MKTVNKYIILFILTNGLFIVGCQKDVDVPNSDCKNIIGQWEWIYSTGGYGLEIKTPETQGYSQSIQFDKNGKYYIYIDNKITVTGEFEFKIAPSIYATGNDYLIYYKNFQRNKESIHHSFEFADMKTLVLSEQCYDCYSDVYLRK